MNRQPSGFPGCESPGAAALPGGSRPGVSAARNGSQQLPPARCPGSPSILGPADSQGRRPVPGARDPCFYPETVPCVSGRLPRQADFSSPPEPPRLGCFPCRLVSFARLQEDSVWVGPGQADRTIPTAIKLDLGKVGPGPLVLQCGLCGFHQLLRGLRDTALPSGCWRFVEVDGGGGGGEWDNRGAACSWEGLGVLFTDTSVPHMWGPSSAPHPRRPVSWRGPGQNGPWVQGHVPARILQQLGGRKSSPRDPLGMAFQGGVSGRGPQCFLEGSVVWKGQGTE